MICRNHLDVEEGVRRCARCEQAFCGDCLVDIQGRPFCADCKAERLLDVRSGVDPTRMQYSGFWQRFGGQVLDGLIAGVPAYTLFTAVMMFGMRNPRTAPIYFLVAYLPFYIFPLLYEGLMLSMKNGQTVGKLALRLRVVRADGSRITAAQAWGRAAIRLVLGCIFFIDYIPFFFTDEKTTLHDMVAGTRVVDIS